MFPILPLVCWTLIFGGGGGLAWYYGLPKHKQNEADRFAAHLAWNLFEKTVDELSTAEVDQIHKLTKRHFG